MLQDATFWVAVAFFVFVAAVFRKAASFLTTSLDARGERIRKELDDAQKLREDAQAVLEQCQKRAAEAENEAAAIIAHAHEGAARIRQRAEAEVKAAVKRCEAQAIDRIAQAEASALAEVRNMAVDIAISASRKLFEERVAAGVPDPLIDDSLVKLPQVLN
ncbi:ATP synthase subunit b 3 [Azospirillaceae bacterium]